MNSAEAHQVPPQPTDQNRDNDQRAAEKKQQDRFSFSDKLTFATAVFTGLYLLFTILIWNSMRHTLKLAHLDMRPLIICGNFGDPQGLTTLKAGENAFLHTSIKNVGRTAAHVIGHGMFTSVGTEPPHDPEVEIVNIPILAPGEERLIILRLPSLTMPQLDEWWRGTLHIFVCFRADYRDYAGALHTTVQWFHTEIVKGRKEQRWTEVPNRSRMT